MYQEVYLIDEYADIENIMAVGSERLGDVATI